MRERVLACCRTLVDEAWADQPRFDAVLAQAETDLRRALVDAPDDPWLLTGLGAVLCDRGQVRDAVAALEHAARCGSTDSNTFFNLGVARIGVGAPDKAATAFADAARLAASPHTWTAYFDPHAM